MCQLPALPAGMRVSRLVIVVGTLAVSGCAPAGYMYDTGSFVAHPTPALCASRNQVLDPNTLECVTPPPSPPPTAAQVAQAQQSNTITNERNACVGTATAKFKRGEQGQLGSYAIWRMEMKQCEDVMVSRLTGQKLKTMGGNCSLKLDWMLRYRSMVQDPDQQAMAEDRYSEICAAR